MLINFVFESMRRELEDALKAHEKDPFKALSKQLHNLQVSHNRFKSVSGCERAAFHPTRLSSFSGSKSKLAVLRSINEWKAL